MVSEGNSLLLYNGRVTGLAEAARGATAVLVVGGRIKAVGGDEALRAAAPRGVPLVDLAGRAVVPGFIDSHLHLINFGVYLQRLDLMGVRSLAELVRRVAERHRSLPAGDWVIGRGWDQDLFAEKRYPTRQDLDAVAPDRPVALTRACGHVMAVNSEALRRAGVTAQTPDPAGGRIDRDAAGEPTGTLRERAMGLVSRFIPKPSAKELEPALRAAVGRALAAGVTGVHSDDCGYFGFGPVLDLYRRSLGPEALPFRVSMDVSNDVIGDLLATDLRTGSGNEYVKIGSVKMFADGSLGASTAALSEPYSDAPGNRGIPVVSPGQMKENVLRAHRAGMQVAVHAIGDLAIGMTLDAYEAALAAAPRPNHRHRIIHCQIMRPEQFDRFARLGVVADIQPKFITTDMRWAERRVGPGRVRTSYAWRTFLDQGVHCAGGSDCPVEPLDPALGLHSAVTREDLEGQPQGGWLPEQKLTAEEALHLFTLGGAYAAFEEKDKGSIEPGKLGDLVVLDRDPTAIPGEALKDLRVEITIVGGRVAFRRD
ncbi:MAG: amidohydrolase [Bacillota bacterium]